MKIFTYILVTLLSELALGSQWFIIEPENRIRISACSERLFVIEISKVEWRPAIEDRGLELRELLISGKVVEVVRGKSPDKVFTHTCQDVRVSNLEAFKKAYGKTANSGIFDGTVTSEKTGAGEIKVGLRYLVLYFRNIPYFMQVTEDDQSWRGKLLEFRGS